MLSCPQSLGGFALLLIRALSFLHGGIHLRLRVAHTRRDGTWRGPRKGAEKTSHPVASSGPVVPDARLPIGTTLLIGPGKRHRHIEGLSRRRA
jgi:hypothetical protein